MSQQYCKLGELYGARYTIVQYYVYNNYVIIELL